jgi:glutamyl-Q tRNA(Asp) synthetase
LSTHPCLYRGPYRGRFAPSPTGPLHAGSLVAALASWLDARVHGGRWLVRIEDTDSPRCVAGAAEAVLGQLAACGLVADEPPLWQHTRSEAYAAALQTLRERGQAYDCGCTRADIDTALADAGRGHQRFGERIYPGTCRAGLKGKPARAVRLRLDGVMVWHDRRLGGQQQDLTTEVGDIVLRRADGLWAYQLAVVVDDAVQGISDVVRGEDLADNTARQIALQRALGLPTPRYLHTPLVMAADGHKLSKQNGAAPLDLRDDGAVRTALAAAGRVLGVEVGVPGRATDWLAAAVPTWAGIIAGPSTEPRQGTP